MFAVQYENYRKLMNIGCGQNAEDLNFKGVSTNSYNCAVKS
jgi:hypothetical protein